jgi:hypothetical protein
MRPDFNRSEALAALYYARRNVRVQQTYLDDDKKRNPLSNLEYSKWKLQEALDDLKTAEERVNAYGLGWLDPETYSKRS